MVKICPNTYTGSNQDIISTFEKYPFPLSSFQKYAIESIVLGHHVLVTAHTGSGKTLPAEFAIEHFVAQGKKVIYTSPIKALSNQKFYEFTNKFPHISFGILTGDIKNNPEANVLIMTTEILMNTLYLQNSQSICTTSLTTTTTMNSNSLTHFQMNFETELACVIFDEIHYINDPDRGRVWEETIMMLPKHIQMVMLSATLDSPEKFALWCETRGEMASKKEPGDKVVYLASTHQRVVPLTHYSFITCTQGFFKKKKDKDLEKEMKKNVINKLHVIQDANGKFHDNNYKLIKDHLAMIDDDRMVYRKNVLNCVSKHMVENNMLPAICFVLSRKALEQCANEMTTNLLEDDSKVPYIVRRECETIIRKLPNFNEYLNLPEYLHIVSLFEKGIAIHHAGMIPIFREMVELLFSKGYIKLLFATETFAVGINMPTKTVLFTDCNKFDGNQMRTLYSHEYTQMAGRAGRRGIDTIGHVIHLTNLFKNRDTITIQKMMKGKPQVLVSKFKVSYNLILNLIDIGETDYTKYVSRSMIQGELDSQMIGCLDTLNKLEQELDTIHLTLTHCRTPIEKIKEYLDAISKSNSSKNRERKDANKQLLSLTNEYKSIEKDTDIFKKYKNKCNEVNYCKKEASAIEQTLQTNIQKIIHILSEQQFINLDTDTDTTKTSLTIKGRLATTIREVHCLIFADILESATLKTFEAKHICAILSCFTNITVPEDKRVLVPYSKYPKVKEYVTNLQANYQKHLDIEVKNGIDTGMNYQMTFDIIDYIVEWCECEDDIQCKELIQRVALEKEIFLGEFVKAVLKINNITSEMEKVAEIMGDVDFLHRLKQVPILTMKYVASNQSLYV
jgi:superfamily II RNA helicase